MSQHKSSIFIFIILMIYLKLQLVETSTFPSENVLFEGGALNPLRGSSNNKPEKEYNTTIYLNSSFLNPPFKCGLRIDTPCNNPKLAFKYVLKPMIENEILLHWNELSLNKLKIIYTVIVFLLDDFDKNVMENCGLDLFFKPNFAKVSSNVAIQLEFKSLGNRIFTYRCTTINYMLFSTEGEYNTNLITSTNFHKISLEHLTVDLNFVTQSNLSHVGITSQKLHVYNSSLISCLFYIKYATGIVIDQSYLKGIHGSINTVTSVKLLNSVILHDSDNTLPIWTILNIDHLQMTNLLFIDSNPFASILKLSSIQKTDISGSKFISSRDNTEQVGVEKPFLIYAEMILNIRLETCQVLNLTRGWLSLKYTSDVTMSRIKIIGNIANTRVLFLERVNEFAMDGCESNNNIGGVLNLIDASNAKISNSRFSDNQIANDNGGSVLIDSEFFISVDSFFKSNIAINGSGGAIAVSDSTLVSLDRSTFISNEATISGGAVAVVMTSNSIVHPPSHVTYSFFRNNRINNVGDIHNSYCKGFFSCEGSGGAVSLRNIATFYNVNATGNYAIWGGAVFTINDNNKPVTLDSKSVIEGNHAQISGGGVFSINGHFVDPNLKNNSAGFYGANIASSIQFIYAVQTTYFGMDGKYLFATNNSATLKLYLGQYAFIEILKSADYYGNLVNIFRENIEPISNSSLSIPKCDYNIIENGINISFSDVPPQTSESSKFHIFLKITSRSIPINVIIVPCPYGYSLQEGVCAPSFPMEVLISTSVVGVLLALISGIIIGLLITFAFRKLWSIKDKLKKLRKLEKAEEDIEKRLLKSELHKNYGINYDPKDSSTKKKKAMNFLINSDDLKIEKKIGEGAYGSIFLAKCWETTNVAIKSFHQKSEETETNEEEFEREVSLLVNLRNPYIVTFYGVSITESKRFMVVEYCERGSLEKIINDCRNGKDCLTLSQKAQILLDISSGMKYLHGLKPKLIHRDLKPANVLINAAGQAKVCDFGLSKIVSTNSMKQSIFTMTLGTLFYMAPESSLGEAQDSFEDRDLLTKIDVFSFAIIMYQLFFEEDPYLNEDSKKIHFFSNGKSWKIGSNNNNNGLNIIFRVAKEGLRPLIPFENRNELSEWADVYLFNNYTNITEDQKKQILDGVDLFVNLMQNCWSQDPINRPKFSDIFNDLKKIKKLFQ